MICCQCEGPRDDAHALMLWCNVHGQGDAACLCHMDDFWKCFEYGDLTNLRDPSQVLLDDPFALCCFCTFSADKNRDCV